MNKHEYDKKYLDLVQSTIRKVAANKHDKEYLDFIQSAACKVTAKYLRSPGLPRDTLKICEFLELLLSQFPEDYNPSALRGALSLLAQYRHEEYQ